jgi:hypothetical protein
MAVILHAADGLIRAGFTGADLNRFFIFYTATWCVLAVIIVLIYGPSLVRKPVEPVKSTLIGQAAPVK